MIWPSVTDSSKGPSYTDSGTASITDPDAFNQRLMERVMRQLEKALTRSRLALEEIARGEGPYSKDRLTHAENTIRAMKKIAVRALEEAS